MKSKFLDTLAFVRKLRDYDLTSQQKKTLRGQALSGDLEGARKGLFKLTGCRG